MVDSSCIIQDAGSEFYKSIIISSRQRCVKLCLQQRWWSRWRRKSIMILNVRANVAIDTTSKGQKTNFSGRASYIIDAKNLFCDSKNLTNQQFAGKFSSEMMTLVVNKLCLTVIKTWNIDKSWNLTTKIYVLRPIYIRSICLLW